MLSFLPLFMVYSTIEGGKSMDTMSLINTIYRIDDSNDLQTFPIFEEGIKSDDREIRYLKVSFNSFSDFYGRVTIYTCQIHGCELSS